jgi:CDP-glycerol glycerophosphotransferase (TagB/SpsB family)
MSITKNNNNNTFRLLKSKDGYILKKKDRKAHNITIRILKIEEDKKRHKITYDTTYNPSDKQVFNNNIDLWRIRCYNLIDVL